MSKIIIDDKEMNISTGNAQMCVVMVNGAKYIVPYSIGKLIEDLTDQISFEQSRKVADDEKIKDFIKGQSQRIALALSGKNGIHVYGENLLKYDADAKIPLPKDYEDDNGRTWEPFSDVVARRVRSAIDRSGLSNRFGGIEKVFDGSHGEIH